jgi:hypothetical protein
MTSERKKSTKIDDLGAKKSRRKSMTSPSTTSVPKMSTKIDDLGAKKVDENR